MTERRRFIVKAGGAMIKIATAMRKAKGFMAWFIVRKWQTGQQEN